MSRYISPVLYILLMLVGCVAFVAIAGVRVGFIEPSTAFTMLRKTVYAALALTVLTLASMAVCRKECNRNPASRRFFMLVGIISFVYSAMWMAVFIQKSKLPDLYDISTDVENPPIFINMTFVRKASEHDLVYQEEWGEIQKEYYPDVKPLIVNTDFKRAYIEALSLTREKGWDLVAQYPGSGVIEATARTPIFGLRNDVVLRISRVDGAVKVDMRSCSRMGESDHGENAERIKQFLGELASRLNPEPLRVTFRN